MKSTKTKKVYVCGVDWQHEVGEEMLNPDIVVYPSVESLKKYKSCWKQCGIVELEVKLNKWIEPQKFHKEE